MLRWVMPVLVLAALVAGALFTVGSDAQEATPAPAAPGAVRLLDRSSIAAPEGVRLLALSPDGRLMAGAKDRAALCVYEVPTMAERACADTGGLDSGIRYDDVVWSPDSTRLAFGEEAFKFLRDGDLWAMDAATGTLTNLDDDGFGGERLPILGGEPNAEPITLAVSPAWSPDGQTIAFSRSTIRNGAWAGNDIATVDAAGGKVRLLTRVTLDLPGVVYFGMQYAPDGATLVYAVAYPDADHRANGLYAVDVTTGLQRRILGADPELGVPSPLQVAAGGSKALLFYPIGAAQFSTGPSPFYAVVDLESGEQEFLEPETESPGASVGVATLSPDGTRVLQLEHRLPGGDRLVVVDLIDGRRSILVDGIEPGSVTPTTSMGRGLFWTANGTIFAGTIDGGTIYAVEPTAVEPPAESQQPTGSPEPAATPASSGSGDFAAGATVTVNDNDVPLRAAPATGAQTVATLALGTPLSVVGPPVAGDGFTWVPVVDPATGTIGYVRAEFLS